MQEQTQIFPTFPCKKLFMHYIEGETQNAAAHTQRPEIKSAADTAGLIKNI